MHKLKLAAALSIATAVAACDLDDGFAIACATVPTADAAFQIYVSSGKVSADVIAKERIAVQSAQAACNGPRPKDAKTAIAYVQRITTAILQATADAKRQAGG